MDVIVGAGFPCWNGAGAEVTGWVIPVSIGAVACIASGLIKAGGIEVVVFGDIDGTVVIDSLDPENVAIWGTTALTYGARCGSVVYYVGGATSCCPAVGVAPGDVDTVFFVCFPAGIRGTFADIATDDVTME